MANSSTQPSYTAKLGLVTISTANSNLDGTGTLGTIITGAANGTFVKTLIIKAQTNVSQGMLRFFAQKSGGHNNLLSEINVMPINKSSRDLSFYAVVPLNYTLESGEVLKVSTENSDTFNIVAESFDINYIATPDFLGTSLEYTAASGSNTISVANPNLDGTGTMNQILVAGTTSSFLGCVISSIMIKAQQTTSPGMVRLFMQNASAGTPFLFCEVCIPSVIQSATTQSFACQVIPQGSLCIPNSYSIWASTENSETFSVVIEGFNWSYV